MATRPVRKTPYTPRPDLAIGKPCDCAKRKGAYALADQLGLVSYRAATPQGVYAALSQKGYVWDAVIGVWVRRDDWA